MSGVRRPRDPLTQLADLEQRMHRLETQATGAQEGGVGPPPNAGPHTHSHDTELTGVSADDHHAQSHGHSTHTGIGANDHHAQAHTMAQHTDGPYGGGGGTGTPLPLDVVPGSPHAKDDEFTGAALDAKWTNPLSSGADLGLTLVVANDWLSFEPATSGSASTAKHAFGIRQPAPPGDFTVSARIADGGSDGGTDDSRTGLFVARTATSQAHVLGRQSSVSRAADVLGSTTYSETADWGAYDGYNVSLASSIQTVSGTWYRIKWDATAGTLSFYYSTDGVRWLLFATRTGQAQPDRIGLVVYAQLGDVRADHSLGCDWFRVTEP